MQPEISILAATIRVDAIRGFLANLEATLGDPGSCEVLIKIDVEQPEMQAVLEAERRARPFSIKVFSTPRGEGYWDLWRSYNAMCGELAPSSRYVVGLNDGCRFAERGWDGRLLALPAPFADGIYHWRFSPRRRLRFQCLAECLPFGESFAFFSRRWIELTEGWAIGPACSDTGQECVNYFLRRFHGLERGVADRTVRLAGEEAAISAHDGLTAVQWRKKLAGINQLYARILSRDFCERHFARAAATLALAAAAGDAGRDARVVLDAAARTVALVSPSGRELGRRSYALDFETWVDLLFDYRPVTSHHTDWAAWPPLLANQLVARRVAAERLLAAPAEAPPPVPAATYRKLLSIRVRERPLDDYTQITTSPSMDEYLRGGGGQDETHFRQQLFDAALHRTGAARPGAILAAALYLSDKVIREEDLLAAPLPAQHRAHLQEPPRPEPVESPRGLVVVAHPTCAATLRRSLESVLRQSYTNRRVVVWVDPARDGLAEVLHEYAVEIEVQQAHGGPLRLWELLAGPGAEFSCYLPPGGELAAGSLEAAAEAFLRHPGAGLLAGGVQEIAERGLAAPIKPPAEFDLVDLLSHHWVIPGWAALYRTESLRAINLRKVSHPEVAELEIQARLALHQPVALAPKYVVRGPAQSAAPGAAPAVHEVRSRTRVIRFLFSHHGRLGGDERLLRRCLHGVWRWGAERMAALGAPQEAARMRAEAARFAHAAAYVPRSRLGHVSHHLGKAIYRAAHGRLRRSAEALAAALSPATDQSEEWHFRRLAALGRFEDARAACEAHLRLHPEPSRLWVMLAELHEKRGDFRAALACLERARPLPDADLQTYRAAIRLKDPGATSESLLEAHREWVARFLPEARPVPSQPARAAGDSRGLRLGVSCPGWHSATIRFQFLPVVRELRALGIEVHAFTAHEEPDWVVHAVDRLHQCARLSTAEFSALARAQRCDVFMELNGLYPGHRFDAMAGRLAPVQISYLNYTSTCAVPNVDYLLADAVALPPGADQHYTEKIWRLPVCFFCFSYAGEPLPAPAPPPAVRAGRPTFGCFGSGGKFSDETLDLWAALLRKVPASRLLLMNQELSSRDNRAHLRGRFAARGIAGERLELRPGVARADVLETYAAVDVSLDTFPYNGGNTIAESLWQGVPVVTLKGARFSANYGASLLAYSGLGELIAESPAEYVGKAAALAADPVKLADWRFRLRDMCRDQGFSDPPRFARALRDAFDAMLAERLGPPAP